VRRTPGELGHPQIREVRHGRGGFGSHAAKASRTIDATIRTALAALGPAGTF
jgi:hypothetical protein